MVEKRLERLKKLVEDITLDLDKAKELIKKLEEDVKKEVLKEAPGVEGIFDGKYLTTDSGEKMEVPANYAAKSRLVYGDRLKVYEEEGKQMFKQVKKVPRKKVEGVVTKKEGRYCVLTEFGSHDLSAVAIEFNNIEINDQVRVLLPEVNTKAPFATLDKVLTQKEGTSTTEVKPVKEDTPKEEKEEKVEKIQEIDKEFVMDLGKEKKEKVEEVKEDKKVEEKPVEDAVSFALEDDDLR